MLKFSCVTEMSANLLNFPHGFLYTTVKGHYRSDFLLNNQLPSCPLRWKREDIELSQPPVSVDGADVKSCAENSCGPPK